MLRTGRAALQGSGAALQETVKPTVEIQGFFLNNFFSFFLNREEEAAANPSPATSTIKTPGMIRDICPALGVINDDSGIT
mmetsp:Transcript_19589/g.32912  ORF Transcript_19589/g.32912 Transcript_19589/m.32912 type:complete len:80 (-) Transcript_19589:680-919(-)